MLDGALVPHRVPRRSAAVRMRVGPDDATRRAGSPPPLTVEAPHYVVHVRNGSGVNGLAGPMLDRLAALSFVRGTVDNVPDIEESVVRHRDSDDAAEAVAEQLGGFEVEQDDAVPSGHLQVMLGADASSTIPGLPAPAPAAEPSITAAGVPCVDRAHRRTDRHG